MLKYLKRQNEILQQCLDIANVMFIGLDIEGKIILANRKAGEILRLPCSDIVGKNWFDNFIPDNDRVMIKSVFNELVSGKRDRVEFFENNILDSGQQEKTILWHNSILYDHHGKMEGLLSSGKDITKQKKAESDLEKTELQLQKIFDLLPIGLWIADKNGKLLKGNPAGVKIWGTDPGVGIEEYNVFNAYRMPAHDKIEPEDWALAHTIREGITIENELLEIEAYDGLTKLILNYTAPVLDDNDNIVGAIIVNQDVTDEKKLELSLKESEERFQLAMQATEDGIFDWNLVTNEIYYSPRWKNILGYKENEIKNEFSEWERLTRKEDVQESWKMINELLESKRERFEMEFQMQHKDGHWVDILSRAGKVTDEYGKAIRIVGTHADITELKRYREKLEELVEQRTKDLEEKNVELEKYNKLFIGREFRIKELRDQVKYLKEELARFKNSSYQTDK
ncbi:MAG: PAS domain-containing protein [Candidatus Cloacimonetes bacterium]|nr:PAS domain-containing protein [Candidatus Cloacimonadota bacterium]